GKCVLADLLLSHIVPYIDWSPFFMAWEMPGKYPAILNDPKYAEQARELFTKAQQLLDSIVEQRVLSAHWVYGLYPANSNDDDIVVFADETRASELLRFHTLRQQWEREGQTSFRSLADYVAPVESGKPDYIGAFAVTAGVGTEELVKRFKAEHDDYNAIMAE